MLACLGGISVLLCAVLLQVFSACIMEFKSEKVHQLTTCEH